MSATTETWLTTTLTPGDGVRAHPVIRPWSPGTQVQQAGPGCVSWRVFEDSGAALFSTRTGTAYAAGHASYPVADGSAVTLADAAARAAAEEALREVRQLLEQRDQAEARALASAGASNAEIARRLHASREQAASWTQELG
jgi:hypothetical protein